MPRREVAISGCAVRPILQTASSHLVAFKKTAVLCSFGQAAFQPACARRLKRVGGEMRCHQGFVNEHPGAFPAMSLTVMYSVCVMITRRAARDCNMQCAERCVRLACKRGPGVLPDAGASGSRKEVLQLRMP